MHDLSLRNFYLCTPIRDDLATFVAAVIEGGVDVVQLRAKESDARDIVRAGEQVRKVCSDMGVPFILNDRPDLALDLGADGVHVGQDDATVELCRRILGPDSIVGLSTHANDEFTEALKRDATYFSAGPIEQTPTKPGRAGTGINYAIDAQRRSDRPVFVTGGVTAPRIAELAAGGISHFVVVRALTESSNPQRSAREIRQAINEAISTN